MFATPYIINEIYDILTKSPYYTVLEIILFFGVVWLIFHKKRSNGKSLTEEERIALIEKWEPEPLVDDIPANHSSFSRRLVSGRVGKRIIVDGHDCLNLATHNYLGLLEDKEIQEKAIACLYKYGVGSCGPRGFYGTVDVHLELEERLAKFMKMEEAVVYSYGFSTIASAIPAYSKRADIIFCDERINFAIQKGIDASRSTIIYFKHNNVHDLEDRILEQEKIDAKNQKRAAKTRRFIVVEGIYMNTGEICPLAELIELRKKYKLRLFLDESISFGTLGANGRGLTEYLNVDRNEVDLISASLEWAAGSIGGFCVGTSFIVEHQRLSGLGYCFSASLPPLLAQAAINALDRFEGEPKMFSDLQKCSEKIHEKLSKLPKLKLNGDKFSPVKHLYIKHDKDYLVEKELLTNLCNYCIENGLAIITCEYLDNFEKIKPRPSIRVTVNRLLTGDDLDFTIKTIEDGVKKIIE